MILLITLLVTTITNKYDLTTIYTYSYTHLQALIKVDDISQTLLFTLINVLVYSELINQVAKPV